MILKSNNINFFLYLQWWKANGYSWNDAHCNKTGGLSAVCKMPGIFIKAVY